MISFQAAAWIFCLLVQHTANGKRKDAQSLRNFNMSTTKEPQPQTEFCWINRNAGIADTMEKKVAKRHQALTLIRKQQAFIFLSHIYLWCTKSPKKLMSKSVDKVRISEVKAKQINRVAALYANFLDVSLSMGRDVSCNTNYECTW